VSVVCTAATGPHLELFAITGPALEGYARRHGHEFVALHERLAGGRPPAWDKVELLRALVDEHDLVVWVDADALVLDDAPDIRSALVPGAFLHVVEHRARRSRIPNSGVMALRGGHRSAQFLERVWAQRRFVHDRWWENAAINHLLGYRAVPLVGVRPVVPAPWRRGVHHLDHAWNSIPEDPATRPYIVHFPGIPLAERRAGLEQLSVA
jgi:hypothetical protein